MIRCALAELVKVAIESCKIFIRSLPGTVESLADGTFVEGLCQCLLIEAFEGSLHYPNDSTPVPF